MKISNYKMELKGSSTNKIIETEHANLSSWVDSKSNTDTQTSGIILNLSEEGKNLATTLNKHTAYNKLSAANELEDTYTYDEEDQKQKLLSDFIYLLTGKRLKFIDFKLLKHTNESASNLAAKLETDSVVAVTQPRQRLGWGVKFEYNKTYMEESKVSFNANGVINTSDGREIQLDLNLNMSRSFYSQTNLSFKAGDALIDPLVINLGNSPFSLSTKKISFDINVDGTKEDIYIPNSSSGFLVLDKNNNGTIDDGNELFGPQTGDGFTELSKYDEDSNGWIDENDSIYNDLQIWQHDDSGKSTLIALGKAGVGAIYLDNVNTNYKYADNQNNTQGVLRKTGIYLKEDGTANTIQHVDLSI